MPWIFQTDGNYVNFNGGGNLWRLHKDSSCITWHWDQSGDLFFDVYGQEYTVKAGSIADVIIDGVPLSAASGFPTAIRAVFTGLAGGGLVYTALLSQSGTDAPVATVLENTLGGAVVWTRNGVGDYRATLAGAFTENKTITMPFGQNTYMPLGINSLFEYGYNIGILSQNELSLFVAAANFTPTELSVIQGTPILIEIRVYP